MNPHDYIVTVDEYGKPIVSHALFGFGKGSQKQNHKYYTRVEDKGRWRYFYSPEEFRAWKAESSQKKPTVVDKMKGTFGDIKDKFSKKPEPKLERMKNEFRKRAEEAADSAKNAAKDTAESIKEFGERAKQYAEKASTEKTSGSASKSTYGEYTKDDPDFNDYNYRDENMVGDTDFYIHRRKDGTNVILEEDMKWVLPKGVDGKSPAIQKALRDFSDATESARRLGKNYTADDWVNDVTAAIDAAVEETMRSQTSGSTKPVRKNSSGSSGLSGISGVATKPQRSSGSVTSSVSTKPRRSSGSGSSNEPWVSPEYLEALEYNSRKNNYFGRK